VGVSVFINTLVGVFIEDGSLIVTVVRGIVSTVEVIITLSGNIVGDEFGIASEKIHAVNTKPNKGTNFFNSL
jgi:hypothetical protein